MFELIEIRVVRTMDHFAIEKARVEVYPRTARLAIEPLIERGVGHQVEPQCLHPDAWYFPARCSTGSTSSVFLTNTYFRLRPRQNCSASRGSRWPIISRFPR